MHFYYLRLSRRWRPAQHQRPSSEFGPMMVWTWVENDRGRARDASPWVARGTRLRILVAVFSVRLLVGL